MKKMRCPFMIMTAIIAFSACSSEETVENIENADGVIAFTAIPESSEATTRAVISSENNKQINWETGDRISIFDGKNNKEFTLKKGGGTSTATFVGTAEQADTYVAVYPYTAEAVLANGAVTNITLPAIQTATPGSFDKNAALMMGATQSTTLLFKNVVGYVKVNPKFNCSRIELKAPVGTTLSGKATLSYNNGEPTMAFTADQSSVITLLPAERGSIIAADNSYYIAVPAVTLGEGWTITFVNSNDTKAYTRLSSKQLALARNKVVNLGMFEEEQSYWYRVMPSNGSVKASQQVDLGVFAVNGTRCRLVFAKSNLTTTGLAANESDFGDFFAWGALEPWYTSLTTTPTSITVNGWKEGKDGGYTPVNCPSSGSSDYVEDGKLKKAYDAASHLLAGDWQIPTKEIWEAIQNVYSPEEATPTGSMSFITVNGIKGMQYAGVAEDKSAYLFLPASGTIDSEENMGIQLGTFGYYWSGTPSSTDKAYCYTLYHSSEENSTVTKVHADETHRYFPYTIRAVRLADESSSEREESTGTEELQEEDVFEW